jgi:VIT1/CCC1 family predicted Fe2+/Mn2+ transporter
VDPDPDIGSQIPWWKSPFFVVLEEVVGTAVFVVGGAFIKSEQTAAIVLTMIVGGALLALGVYHGWKNRRDRHG